MTDLLEAPVPDLVGGPAATVADFILASMQYLSRQEQEDMLHEMRAFDQGMIHRKYHTVVEQLQS